MTGHGQGPRVLCLSRSYLAHLLPTLGARHAGTVYAHIVQTTAEQHVVEQLGGEVVLNLEAVVRAALAREDGPVWQEPVDFRTVTDFPWCPLQSDRYLPALPTPMRMRVAGAVQAAVADLFARRQFDGFVSEPVALFVTHLLLYHCRKSGTRPLLWANTYFPDHFYFADGPTFSVPVRHAPESPLADLPARVRAYAEGVAADTAGPVYHHAFTGRATTRFDYFKQRRGARALVLRPGWTSRAIQVARLGRAMLKRALLRQHGDFMTAGAVAEHRFYLRCLWTSHRVYDLPPSTPADRHVVFPLQFEPEASLLYCAPHVVSQVEFVELLLKALPPDAVLWVKEHPNQFGALGLPRWRALRRRYPQLRLVHGRQSGRDLIKRAGLVVSISSSMGMDALLCGRRVIVVGDVFYRTLPGAIPVSSATELVEALRTPAHYGTHTQFDACVEALTAFGRKAYAGDPQPSATLYEPANLDALVAAIQAELSACA